MSIRDIFHVSFLYILHTDALDCVGPLDATEHVVSVHVDTRNKICYLVIMIVIGRSRMMAEDGILYRLLVPAYEHGHAYPVDEQTVQYVVLCHHP